jgi:hypothetical protein
VILMTGAVWTVWQARQTRSASAGFDRRAGSWPQSEWKNTRPETRYTGDASCARCHADIARTFALHPMGRSLAPIASAPAVGEIQTVGSASFAVGQFRFTIERQGGHEIHREALLDNRGQPLAQVEGEVKYALGSGSRGITYLVQHDGRLFESPISWYSQKGRWDLSPGYEAQNAHFNRAIEPSCLFCHSNRVQPVERSTNRYTEPVFLGHSIGCERCHGPGELHVREHNRPANAFRI